MMGNGMHHFRRGGGDPIHSSHCHLKRGRYSLFLKAVGYSGLTRSQQLTEDFHQFGKHLQLGRLLKSNNLFGSRVSSWSKPRPQSKTGPFAGSVHVSHSNNRFPCAWHCTEGIRSTRRERVRPGERSEFLKRSNCYCYC